MAERDQHREPFARAVPPQENHRSEDRSPDHGPGEEQPRRMGQERTREGVGLVGEGVVAVPVMHRLPREGEADVDRVDGEHQEDESPARRDHEGYTRSKCGSPVIGHRTRK